MMNNMKMMNDMELEMAAGGEAVAHSGGASGGWEEAPRNGPVSINAETFAEAVDGCILMYDVFKYIYFH